MAIMCASPAPRPALGASPIFGSITTTSIRLSRPLTIYRSTRRPSFTQLLEEQFGYRLICRLFREMPIKAIQLSTGLRTEPPGLLPLEWEATTSSGPSSQQMAAPIGPSTPQFRARRTTSTSQICGSTTHRHRRTATTCMRYGGTMDPPMLRATPVPAVPGRRPCRSVVRRRPAARTVETSRPTPSVTSLPSGPVKMIRSCSWPSQQTEAHRLPR